MKPLLFARSNTSASHDAVAIMKELRPMLGIAAHRATIQEAIALLESDLRLAPSESLEQWRQTYAPRWEGKKVHEQFFRLCIANGRAHRDEIARILGTPEEPATLTAVRQFVTRLRTSLEFVEATFVIEDAGRDGYYSTQALPVIQTLNISGKKPLKKV